MSQKTLIVVAVPVSEISFQFISDVMLMNKVDNFANVFGNSLSSFINSSIKYLVQKVPVHQ
jgi:hypothetical protein